jgi:hypothetical protein
MSEKNKNQIINAGCASIGDGGIWFVHYVLPVLMFYDFGLKQITKTKIIPCGKSPVPWAIYAGIIVTDKKVFLFPRIVRESFVYDIETDQMRKLDTSEFSDNFFRAYNYNEYIYAMPIGKSYMLKINIITEEVEHIKRSNDLPLLKEANCLNGRNVICLTESKEELLVFELDRENWRRLKLHNGNCNGASIDYINGNMYVFDLDTQKIIEIDNHGYIKKRSSELPIKSAAIYHTPDGKVVVNSNYSGEIFYLDNNLEVVEKDDIKIPKSSLISPYLIGCWLEDKKNTFGILKSNELIVIDKLGRTFYKLQMEDIMWKNLAKKYLDQIIYEKPITENELYNIHDFLDSIRG